MRTHPPTWAEAILRGFLKSESFGNVSGDLLEQYRDSILPTRGLRLADRWYLSQVFGYVLRAALPWAALFAVAMVARNTLDWLSPTTDYHTRSVTSTALAVGILLASGFWTAWRSRSFFGGAAAGLAASIAAAALTIVGNAILLAFSGVGPIQGSGGLDELFHLPVMLILPGMVIGGIGALVGTGARKFSRAA
jgi:hypothetical protein